MFRTIERFATWAARYRSSFKAFVVLGVGEGLLLHFGPRWIDHAQDFSPKAIHIGLTALLGILGIGGLAFQVLHIVHWFGPARNAKTAQPLIYTVDRYARPFVVLMIVLAFVIPLGSLYLGFFFATINFR